MIEINLLPDELKKKESPFKALNLSGIDLKSVPVIPIAAGLVGLLLAMHILLFLVGIYGKIGFANYTKKYDAIAARKSEADALKAQVVAIHKKVAAIDDLMARRFAWSKKLNALSDFMTPGIWLVSLDYEEKMGERQVAFQVPGTKGQAPQTGTRTEKGLVRYFVISGYASSMGEQGAALVGRFIKNLKENGTFYSDLNSIELVSIKSEKFDNQDVMAFRIICSFK